jgi:hypothetical protein
VVSDKAGPQNFPEKKITRNTKKQNSMMKVRRKYRQQNPTDKDCRN